MQFATTSKSGTGNSPGGSPTSTQVPRLRVMPTPCLKAIREGAVIKTPWAPPPVSFFTAARVSGLALMTVRAEALCVGELAVINVDRADEQAHRLGILDGQVTEAPAQRLRSIRPASLRLLDSLIRRDASTT